MKVFLVERRFLGLFPYTVEVERPHIKLCSPSGKLSPRYAHVRRCYSCEGAGQIGFGVTPKEAWNDWANWALI